MPGYFAGGGALLAVAHIDDALVWLTAQRLLYHGVSIMSGCFEHCRQ